MTALYPSDQTFPGANTFPGQSRPVWHLLHVSFDPVATPWHERTWTDITGRLRSWSLAGGRQSRLSDMDATTATYVLDDRDRELDPTNAASSLAPLPNRLVWHRVQAGGRTYPVFFGYSVAWGPEWEDGGVGDQRARLVCADGRKRLNEISLPFALLDVAEYDELVSALDPSLYYRMGEPQGTKLVGHSRVIRFKKGPKKGKRKRVKRWKTRETRAATTGVSGPSGTYVNTPLLGQPGAIAGDPDTAVRFRSSQSEYARVVVDADDFKGLTGVTVECWVKLASLTGQAQYFVTGPMNSDNLPMFALGVDAAGRSFFFVDGTSAGSNVDGSLLGVGDWYHLVGTWSPGSQAIYENGQEAASASGPAALLKQGGTSLLIGALLLTGLNRFADATIDEVAIYEKALAPARITAHSDAGRLGLPSSLTGHRIGELLDLLGEFPAWNVQAGARLMDPVRYAGLSPAELIDEAEGGEGLPGVFFFDRDGKPTFLAADHRAAPPYDSPSVQFGGGSDPLPVRTVHLSDQDANLFNEIRGTIEGGDATVVALDQDSIDEYGHRVLPVDLPLADEAEAQAYVDDLLAQHKDPIVPLERVTLIGKNSALLDALLSLDLGDSAQVTVNVPGGGDPIVQESFIERRQLSQANVAAPIVAEFSISPR